MAVRSILLVSVMYLPTFFSTKAQGLMTITDAPFSAIWTRTTDNAGDITTVKVVGARSSNGSTYTATYRDDTIVSIQIQDVQHERRILILPSSKQATESIPSRGRFITRTVEQQRAVLERWQIAHSTGSGTAVDEITPLGKKEVEKMTLYGQHYLRTRGDTLPPEEGENWLSDLGFNYTERREVTTKNQVTTSTMTELTRSEPDPSLFVVPNDYTILQR